MTKTIWVLLFICGFTINTTAQEKKHNLQFDTLAKHWDEALPIGNGMLGALIWEKNGNLRISLDRADLWDERPMKGLHREEFSFKWVQEQVAKKQYDTVQKLFDRPYDREPAPSKIPGGAIEVPIKSWGAQSAASIDLKTATSTVTWKNGTILKSFVHATSPVGWIRLENVPEGFDINLIAPQYTGATRNAGDPVKGDDLSRLGYQQGKITKMGKSISYTQEGWGGFRYTINLIWKQLDGNTIEGVWTISSSNQRFQFPQTNEVLLEKHLSSGFNQDHASHKAWWAGFWNKSAIRIPDDLIEKQWYLEQYKFGSTSRKGAPPISLQAIWTADNGRIPPWKGDYHHDLNTELSYWPAYSANHLEEGIAYLDHLDQNKENYKRYTQLYFGVDGLNVPGVTTLEGTEMGGWIQYALSPTVSSWLSHHYYLQWRYSMDKQFLKNRAYPWIAAAATYLENLTVINKNGFRKLPISSSPEINGNSLDAWFNDNTNYDLALMKFNFKAAKELALELGLKKMAAHWDSILMQLPAFSISETNALNLAPGVPYATSHRHFSHLLSIHPLGLIKAENGTKEKNIIQNSLHQLDSIGPSGWCGYSYAWLSNMKARAKDGDGAAKALQIFAKAFCSVNSFHVNGDQTKSGYSGMTYRPFTLEGNFAFASGVQEMMLQSHAGFIEVFPAVPDRWKDVSFQTLRAEGAYLVSAVRQNGLTKTVTINSEKGGTVKLKLDTRGYKQKATGKAKMLRHENGYTTIEMGAGGTIVLYQ
jgi:alpha-L-fucosidase 2